MIKCVQLTGCSKDSKVLKVCTLPYIVCTVLVVCTLVIHIIRYLAYNTRYGGRAVQYHVLYVVYLVPGTFVRDSAAVAYRHLVDNLVP